MCITRVDQIEDLPDEVIVYKVFRKTPDDKYVSPYFPNPFSANGNVARYYHLNKQYKSTYEGKYGFYGFQECPTKDLVHKIAVTTFDRSTQFGKCVVCKVKLTNLYMIGSQQEDNLLDWGNPSIEYNCIVAGTMEIIEEVSVSS